MRRAGPLLLVVLASCGGGRVGDDLDTETRAPARVTRCRQNCQSVDWIDRRPLDALADIAVCLDLPAYAPARLEGAVTIAFRELPCRQAIAQVAAAAGLRMVISTVEGRRAVLLRRGGQTAAEQLVLLPRGDGWRPAGAAGRTPAGRSQGSSEGSRHCLDGCQEQVRSCMERCHWNDNACVRACQDRYRLCTDAC